MGRWRWQAPCSLLAQRWCWHVLDTPLVTCIVTLPNQAVQVHFTLQVRRAVPLRTDSIGRARASRGRAVPALADRCRKNGRLLQRPLTGPLLMRLPGAG